MRTRGCGHGECTTADTPCRYGDNYDTPECAPRLWTKDEGEPVRWSPADLDRCEHGRHSADHCFDCPGGHSRGNPFLFDAVPHEADHRPRHVRTVDGQVEVRIGTMVRGEPIWVVVRDRPRETSVTEDDKLPCSECGHRVRPGLHTQAECLKYQQDDAAEASQDTTEEQTDGE